VWEFTKFTTLVQLGTICRSKG